jgi:hypothetical protein
LTNFYKKKNVQTHLKIGLNELLVPLFSKKWSFSPPILKTSFLVPLFEFFFSFGPPSHFGANFVDVALPLKAWQHLCGQIQYPCHYLFLIFNKTYFINILIIKIMVFSKKNQLENN